MKLESVVNYHSPRSLSPHALSIATSPDNLSGTDVMAALGMALKCAPLGYSAFCSKMNLSQRDRKRTEWVTDSEKAYEPWHIKTAGAFLFQDFPPLHSNSFQAACFILTSLRHNPMSKLTTGAAYSASAGAIVHSILTWFSPEEWSALGVLVGISIAIVTFIVNWY